MAATNFAKLPLPCLAVLKEIKAPANDDDAGVTPTSSATATTPLSFAPEGTRDDELPPASKVSPEALKQYPLALILQANSERIAFFEKSQQAPTVLPVPDFVLRYAGQVLLFAPEGKANLDNDVAGLKKREFGFKWFIPELLKHKDIWRDVLLRPTSMLGSTRARLRTPPMRPLAC